MHHRIHSIRAGGLAALLFAALFILPTLASAKGHETWVTENQALDARYLKAISDGDIDTIMTCWSKNPNAAIVTGGKVIYGSTAIRAYYAATAIPDSSSTASNMTVRYWRDGDMVFAAGSVTITVKLPDKTEISFLDVWSDVRHKERGKWVYILDHVEFLPPE
jgi:ketosteroid isomerase-like protein